MESLRSIFIKKACPGEVRGRNPEDIFFWIPDFAGQARQDHAGVRCPVIGFGWNFGCISGAEFKKHFGRPPSSSGGHWNPPATQRASTFVSTKIHATESFLLNFLQI